MRILVTLISICLMPATGFARVFDFKNETFAAYVGGSFGNTNLGEGAYGLSGGPGTTFDKKPQSQGSAEGGISMTLGRVAVRLGVDYVFPRTQVGIIGTDSSGNQLYELTSAVSAFAFMGNLELIGYKGSHSRALLGAGYGTATLDLSNEYTMSDAGISRFGIGSFTEKGTGTAPLMQAYIGFEVLFTDNATATFTAGYRYLVVPEMKSTKETTAISGSQTKGGPMTNHDGSPRSLNLSGGFAGLIFKFYP